LEVGKWADLIVLTADPRVNIRNTRQIEAVYIAGNQVAP
jgi:imidazolonepropionase-like amidohydrolase